MGATQASAGMLAPYIEGRAAGPLLELTARSLDLFDTFVAGASAAGGLAVSYRRSGTLEVATEERALDELRASAATLATRNVAFELLDARAAREHEPHLAADVLGGLLVPAHGFVAAAELTRALETAARRQGARLSERGRVIRIASSRGGVKVETDRGSIAGGAAVLAAGAWSAQIQIEGVPRLPIRPVRGQLLQLGWVGPPLRRVTWAERCYVVPWEDGTVLVGATMEDAGFDERATLAGVRDLIESAAELLPHAWTAGFRSARVGLRPAGPDDLPIIGRSRVLSNLMYATGHFRNGVLLAPLTAELVADAMLDERLDPLLELTRPQRFGAY
jgi:glycine oxidase